MLTNKFAFFDINYGEFASITGTNLNTSTAVYAYDNRSDAGNTTWNTTTGSLVYYWGTDVHLDSFFINNHNWQNGTVYKQIAPKLLLHCDGLSGSAVFVDSSLVARTVYNMGSVIQTAAIGAPFGTGSAFFPGTSTAQTMLYTDQTNDFSFADDPFTVLFWVRCTAFPSLTAGLNDEHFCLFTSASNSSSYHTGGYITSLKANTATSKFMLKTTVDGSGVTHSLTAMTLNTWHFMAYSKPATGSAVNVYLDTNKIGEIVAGLGDYNCLSAFCIGSGNNPTTNSLGSDALKGYMDEFVVIKGVGLYDGTTISVPASPFTSTGSFYSITSFSNLTTSSYYYNNAGTIAAVGVKFEFTSTQDSLTGTAGEIIATKQKFALSRNPSKYIPSKTPILKTNRLYNGPIVSTRVGDYFEAQIGWSMLLGDPNTLTNTDLQNVTELARQNISFLFWPNANNDFLNLQTWRKEDVFKCKINDQVSYEFADPDTRSIIADYLIEETK